MIAIGFPLIYRQGPGLFEHLGEYVSEFGHRPLIIADQFVKEVYGEKINAILRRSGIDPTYNDFRGECAPAAISNAVEQANSNNCDCVLGLGGGKAIDAAKAVKAHADLPVIVVPTIASNDSPTSRLAITYEEDGSFIGPIFLKTNPEAILVDTQVIAQAPIRFFRAGIADALATKFEADQVIAAGKQNFFDAQPTEAAICLANHCYSVIRQYAKDAVADVSRKRATLAVEKVTEANILLSGLGFEGCGVSGAHGIGMALTVLAEAKGILHGEEVAIGLLAQLMLEGRSDAFMTDIKQFYTDIGLPSSLSDVGLSDCGEDDLQRVAAFATREGSRLHNMNVTVTAADVLRVLLRLRNFPEQR